MTPAPQAPRLDGADTPEAACVAPVAEPIPGAGTLARFARAYEVFLR